MASKAMRNIAIAYKKIEVLRNEGIEELSVNKYPKMEEVELGLIFL
jgi:hypothetical protein